MERSKRLAGWIEVSKSLRPLEFCTYIGVRQRVLTDMVNRGLKQNADGSYDIMNYLAYLVEKAKKESGVAQLDAERIRKTAADATLAEMRIAEAEGRLIERQAVIRPVRAYLVTACKLIQDLPKRLSRRFPVAERAGIVEAVEDEIRDTLATIGKASEVVEDNEQAN